MGSKDEFMEAFSDKSPDFVRGAFLFFYFEEIEISLNFISVDGLLQLMT